MLSHIFNCESWIGIRIIKKKYGKIYTYLVNFASCMDYIYK